MQMHRLSTIDSGFLLTEARHCPKHVGGLQIMRLPKGKGASWLHGLLDDLKRCPPGYPFSHRLQGGPFRPALVRDRHFDIEYHVRHLALPPPGDDAQLHDLVAQLHGNALDRQRPLWEFYLIEGLARRRFAFFTRIHHAIADGMTFARWFAKSGSSRADATDCRPIWQQHAHEVEQPGLLGSLAGAASDGLAAATGLARLSARLLQSRLLSDDDTAVLPLGADKTALNVPTGAARGFTTCRFDLDKFADIARRENATVNDLVLTLCDLAVYRYLEEHGTPPEQPLVAYMPVDLREGSHAHGNILTLLQVRLAQQHDDPPLALREISASSRTTRDLYRDLPQTAVQLYSLAVALLPLGEELTGLDRLLPPAVNLVISNLPGPRQRMYFRGAEVAEVYPVNTLPPEVALSITVCSYDGRLFFGLVGDRSTLPDLAQLRDFLLEAYSEFKNRPASIRGR